jgi:cholesterol transport system auxiliary component
MRIIVHTTLTRSCAAFAMTVLLAACASKGEAPTQYDFGPLPPATVSASTAATPLPALVITEVSGPAMLDTQRMYYRLLYADAQQSRPYAYNMWSGTPLQLLTLRMKARVAQAGVKVLSTTDAVAGQAVLRIEVDDFAQNFATPAQSSASISLRASVFRAHRLVDQKTFTRSVPATSADAAGGAHALAGAADALADDILLWMAALPLNQD